MSANEKYVFVGRCVDSLGRGVLISYMTDTGKDVSYRTFAKYVDIDEVHDMLGYAGTGLHIKNDWAVTFHKVRLPSGVKGVFLRWSGIEHLWLPREDAPSFSPKHEEAILEAIDWHWGDAPPSRRLLRQIHADV